MPNQDFFALYRSAWQISVARVKEAEKQAKEEEEERRKEARGGSNIDINNMSQRQRLSASLNGLTDDDLLDALDSM